VYQQHKETDCSFTHWVRTLGLIAYRVKMLTFADEMTSNPQLFLRDSNEILNPVLMVLCERSAEQAYRPAGHESGGKLSQSSGASAPH
jgi:hypothetical protein